MAHFTYASEPSKEELRQGDVLLRTPELSTLLSRIHPPYANEKYTHFQVLTQSCDLALRGNGICKVEYITLAAVRPLDVIVNKAIDATISSKTAFDGGLYCSDKYKRNIKDFLTKLYNNNHPNFFFLNEDIEQGFNENYCTILQLSFPIKREHYKLCIDAKCVELKNNFRDKLGWLVGNIYSRIGTDDYVPTCLGTVREFDAMVEELLSSYIVWVPDNTMPHFKKAIRSADDESTIDNLMASAEGALKNKLERKVDQLIRVIGNQVSIDGKEEGLKKELMKHSLIRSLV